MKDQKYFGKYRGIVTNNSDPAQMARIKANIPDLFGTNETGWIDSANGFLPNSVFIPSVGDKVWIEFEDGNINLPIYTSCWYSRNNGISNIPNEAKINYPNSHVIKTSAGSLIHLNDIKSSIKISTNSGNKIDIDDSIQSINIITVAGNKLELNEINQSIELSHVNGSKITINSLGITIFSTSIVNINGTNINITASGTINLG